MWSVILQTKLYKLFFWFLFWLPIYSIKMFKDTTQFLPIAQIGVQDTDCNFQQTGNDISRYPITCLALNPLLTTTILTFKPPLYKPVYVHFASGLSSAENISVPFGPKPLKCFGRMSNENVLPTSYNDGFIDSTRSSNPFNFVEIAGE